MENRGARLSRRLPGCLEETAGMVRGRTDPVVSVAQLVPFRSRMGDGEFLAGLVRDRAATGRFRDGFDRRPGDRGAAWGGLGDLRERSRFPPRETIDQTLHRIHLG